MRGAFIHVRVDEGSPHVGMPMVEVVTMATVVVGFDGSDLARRAVMWGAEEARRGDARLLVVQAVRQHVPEPVFTPMSMPIPEFITEETMSRAAEDHLGDLA